MRLIDADKLNLWTALRPYCSSDVCCEVTDIIDNTPTINPYEWISVEERLPEEDIRVLVWLNTDRSYTKIDTDRRFEGKWVRWSTDVTHWMPLPAPPTEKED